MSVDRWDPSWVVSQNTCMWPLSGCLASSQHCGRVPRASVSRELDRNLIHLYGIAFRSHSVTSAMVTGLSYLRGVDTDSTPLSRKWPAQVVRSPRVMGALTATILGSTACQEVDESFGNKKTWNLLRLIFCILQEKLHMLHLCFFTLTLPLNAGFQKL